MRSKKIEVYGIEVRVPKDLDLKANRPKLARMINSPDGFYLRYAWQASVIDLNPEKFMLLDEKHACYDFTREEIDVELDINRGHQGTDESIA